MFGMFAAALLLFTLTHDASGAVVTFDNTKPRYDVNGNIMDAHDGSIQKFSPDGPYWYHAISYGLCKAPTGYGCDQTPDHCGFRDDHNISIWTSPDLSSGSWTYVANAVDISARPQGILYRSHAVYNPNTKKYVLWWNTVGGPDGAYILTAATADSPAGPFVVQVPAVNLTRGGSGDFALFVDDDGTGYVVYGWNYWMSIDQLTPDFLHTTGKNSSMFPEYFVEAPAFYKRNGVYQILFDHCCCFCYQGSGIRVHTATSPLGPYTAQASGDIACVPSNASLTSLVDGPGSEPTPGQGCQYADPTTTSVLRSQQNYVIEVDTPNGTQYIWTGDRWGQSPDGIKGHEPQYWFPLTYNADGTIAEATWMDSFSLDII